MTPEIPFLILYFFFVVMLYSCVIEQPRAFTIKLIHRYAPESPFYNPDLTDQEIVEKLNFQTKARKMGIATTSVTSQAIRPRLDFDYSYTTYLVKVSLGTFSRSSHKSYYLALDTSSSITWLQCEDCKKSGHHCYHQVEPPFPNSKSSSYQPLPCNEHPLCFIDRCIGDSCSYHNKYVDGCYSIGILAHEKFAFPSSTGHEEIVVPLIFGCGINNIDPNADSRDYLSAGLFGLGWGPHSFVTQTNSISHGRFSYCLPPGIQAAQGLPVFMRFGSDIPSYSTLLGTKLIEYEGDNAYYVNLLDISINGARLNIPSTHFQKGGPNVGGCVFDSGCSMTRISPPAYLMVKEAVERHISRYVTSLDIVGQKFEFDLCYRAPKPFKGHSDLPTVTFHFEEHAHLVVKPETAFYVSSHDFDDGGYEYVCLSIFPSSAQRETIIGSDLQANQFIVYDVTGQRMYFGPRDCSHDY